MEEVSFFIKYKEQYYHVLIEKTDGDEYLLTLNGLLMLIKKINDIWIANGVEHELCQVIGRRIEQEDKSY